MPTFTDNSTKTQRSRILRHLREVGPLSTLAARRMGILHPAARCLELREMGHSIVTHKITDVAQDGSLHRVGIYTLQPEKQLSLPGMEVDV